MQESSGTLMRVNRLSFRYRSWNYIYKRSCIIGFMSNELISIVENVGLMGVPMPTVITKAIDVLQNKSKAIEEQE